MKSYLLILISLLCLKVNAQDKSAYQIFNSEGKKLTYSDLLKSALKNDVVLFGEHHNDPVMHWLQLELAGDLLQKKEQNLVLGAEMFEADDQVILDEYLNGQLSYSTFSSEMKLWPNYKTDYYPLTELAKENNLKFIATNIPRRYANMVYKNGLSSLEDLSDNTKSWMTPLPFAYDSSLKCYSDIVKMSGGHGGENLPLSQAIKDATMAHFIARNLDKGQIFLHFNGTYHSDRKEGIAWYLLQQEPKLKVMNIAAVNADDPDNFDSEWKDLGDFILVTDSQMTKTH